MYKLLLTALIVLSKFQSFAQTSKVISGKTSFAIKYWAGTCRGIFDAPTGKVIFDPGNLSESVIDVAIPSSSFHTASAMRDRHMKRPKYFDAGVFPVITFRTDNIIASNDTYYATGEMKIKGISKKVTLPFHASKRQDGSYEITSSFNLRRLDYNVGKPTMIMSNDVAINIRAVIK